MDEKTSKTISKHLGDLYNKVKEETDLIKEIISITRNELNNVNDIHLRTSMNMTLGIIKKLVERIEKTVSDKITDINKTLMQNTK